MIITPLALCGSVELTCGPDIQLLQSYGGVIPEKSQLWRGEVMAILVACLGSGLG